MADVVYTCRTRRCIARSAVDIDVTTSLTLED
jgi:hypothetical protein